MAGTFRLGAIPPTFSVFEGEVLEFTVSSSLGSGAQFSVEGTPTPVGPLSVSERGVVTYRPASEDREEFELWIRARADGQREQQWVRVLPQPRLLPEAVTIDHYGDPIDRKSSLYQTITDHPTGKKIIFNNTADVAVEPGVERENRDVTVWGSVTVSVPVDVPMKTEASVEREVREVVIASPAIPWCSTGPVDWRRSASSSSI